MAADAHGDPFHLPPSSLYLGVQHVSSKKQLRRQRKEQRARQSARKSRINPATAFILVTIALVVIVGFIASWRGESPGEPPWPGAVWSADHGHWH